MTTMRWGPVRTGGVLGVAALLMAAGTVAGGCDTTVPKPGPPTTPAPSGRGPERPVPGPGEPLEPGERRPGLESFLVRATSCESFAEAVRPVALDAVGPYGFAGSGSSFDGREMSGRFGETRSAAPMSADASTAAGTPRAGLDFSTTNVQEAGVDEPDSVKTDGRLLVSTVDGRLRVLDVAREPRLVGTLDLPGGAGELLLVGDRALVLSEGEAGGSASGPAGPPEAMRGGGPGRPKTTVTVVDLKEPAKPSVVRSHSIDGSYLDARLVGGVARIVTRSQPDVSFPQPAKDQLDADEATAANAEIVRRTDPSAFLPQGASCGDAHVPVEAAGVGTIAVQSLDPAAQAPGPAVTVVAEASTVYASAGRLFVATNRYGPGGSGRPGSSRTGPELTAIHAFDITDPAKARYAGSGDVPGRLLNQFSLSEHEGVLRVATTLEGSGAGNPGDPTIQGPSRPGEGNGLRRTQSQSRVSILRPAGTEWVETGAVEGLGKGERIYAVRFLGATGYVVTFRQVDPLYVIDLRDARSPRVTGELKITGYSAYLHPAGGGRLLGIGQEATDQGRRLGTQLSLFDVGNPAAPAKLSGTVLSHGSSSAENDHHAFLYWPANGLVVAPVTSYGGGGQLPSDRPSPSAQQFVGAVAFSVNDKAVSEKARITHPGSTPIERTLVVRDRLLTVSRVGVADNDLASLADRGFLAFR